MRERLPLPSKAEIAAITDPQALRDLLDDIERTTTSIETQLEFDGLGDDDWYARARGALIAHRITRKMATRRLHALQAVQRPAPGQKPWKPAAQPRDPGENHPLTNEVLATAPKLDVFHIPDEAGVAAALLAIVERINAVEADRASEVAMPAQERDEGFLTATKGALKLLKAIRAQLESRRASFKHRAKDADAAERDARRERRFVDAARDLLPRETFLALWARVDREEIEASGVGRAA